MMAALKILSIIPFYWLFSVFNWAEARPEFVKFLEKYEPRDPHIEAKEWIYRGLPKWSIDGFIEDVLYMTVDYEAITKRNINI